MGKTGLKPLYLPKSLSFSINYLNLFLHTYLAKSLHIIEI